MNIQEFQEFGEAIVSPHIEEIVSENTNTPIPNEMQLQINNMKYVMRRIDDPDGSHYVVQSIKLIIPSEETLTVVVDDNLCTYVHPFFLKQIKPDKSGCPGQKTISLPLNASMSIHLRGVYVIDKNFVKAAKGTPHYRLGKKSLGKLAISGAELICKGQYVRV